MEINRKKTAIDVFLYIGSFILAQLIGFGVGAVISGFLFPDGSNDQKLWMTIIGSAIYCVLIIAFFIWNKWCPVGRSYMRSHPWSVLFWSGMAAVGSVIPSAWLMEMEPESWQTFDGMEIFEQLLKNPTGYFVIGLIAPVVEEMVFRGGVLRRIIYPNNSLPSPEVNESEVSPKRLWAGLIISSLLFAVIHGNMAQGPHAFFLGILLGWMYYRTRSIIPGIAFHAVNNTIPYIIYGMFPFIPADAKLAAYFGGDEKAVLMAVLFSLLIFLPSLWQLNILMKKAK